jgi:DNA N-6-adenine-methyltransferase (Dam)
MKPQIVIEASAVDPEIKAINALESQIITSEDDADNALWEQAGLVVAKLDSGMSQEQLAGAWMNLRTKKPYTQQHVSYVKLAFHKYTCEDPRPRWRDAYNEVANPKPGVVEEIPHVARNSGENEWYTPPAFIEAARTAMGGIDCDPASSAIANQAVQASIYFDKESNGLVQRWSGNVWLNPPYAQPLISDFSAAVVSKYQQREILRACILVNNATETDWFQMILEAATAVCFPKSRIRFLDPEGNPGAPLQGQSVLYLGPEPDDFSAAFESFGPVLRHG